MSRILVIEDDIQVRRMLRITLEKAGFGVDVAENGRKGLESLVEHSVDLVVTDLVMPEKEGIETIIDIRREFPGLRIIAISGGGRRDFKGYLEQADRLGACRTFAKPLKMAEFVDAIHETLALAGPV